MRAVQLDVPGEADEAAVLALYRAVAATPGGLARTIEEVTPAWVGGCLARSRASGVSVVAREPGARAVLGEIHASAPEPRVFAHVLGDLTLVVHPNARGQGIGRRLLQRLLDVVVGERPHILRVELVARESNRQAIGLYRQLGFVVEGRFTGRIRSVGGGYEADIPMAWLRPPA